MDLGADEVTTFRKVTLPLILPGIVAAALLAFALSIDDYVITSFVAGQTPTFPLWVFGVSRFGVPPEVNVLGTLIFVYRIRIHRAPDTVGTPQEECRMRRHHGCPKHDGSIDDSTGCAAKPRLARPRDGVPSSGRATPISSSSGRAAPGSRRSTASATSTTPRASRVVEHRSRTPARRGGHRRPGGAGHPRAAEHRLSQARAGAPRATAALLPGRGRRRRGR